MKHDGRDPVGFINYSKSYFNFVVLMGDQKSEDINDIQKLLIEVFSRKINIIEEKLLEKTRPLTD